MKSQLFIPKKIKVGFNLRNDTYTGKLGYVICHDGKKWRKEDSWNGWIQKYLSDEAREKEKRTQYDAMYNRYKFSYNYSDEKIETSLGTYENFRPQLGKYVNDSSIEPVEFENVPTEGFVLNKKAGGGSSGWNHRNTYCRVFDPRGFEFEVSIPNLLFILQESSSFKGKGLEGEFVYSWEGKDLVLLPVCCNEYKQSSGFTDLQSKKIAAKDLIAGCSYKNKRQEDFVYLGRFNYYSLKGIDSTRKVNTEKLHIFVDKNGGYTTMSSLNNLAICNSETPVSNYAELMEAFSKSRYATKPIGIEEEKKELKIKEFNPNSGGNYLPGLYYKKIGENIYQKYNIYENYKWQGSERVRDSFTLYKNGTVQFKDGNLIFGDSWKSDDMKYTQEQLEAIDFKEVLVSLESGSKVKAEQY